MRQLGAWLRKMWLSAPALNPFPYTAAKCGHETKRAGEVTAFEHTTTTKMPLNEEGTVDWCLECLGKMAIRCAWCGDLIFIGDPITLYSPGPRAGFFSSGEPGEAQEARKQEGFVAPDYAVAYCEVPLTLVGCLGWNCADTGSDRAGFWLPGDDGKGRVQRVQTAYEAILAAEDPSMVVVGNSGDMAEAMNPTLVPLEDVKTGQPKG